jgi:hypothetical protein
LSRREENQAELESMRQIGKELPRNARSPKRKSLNLADQFRLRVHDTNGGNWDEEDGWSCVENSIRLYTGLGTQPLTATLYSSILSPIPLGYVSGDIEAFVEFLHLCHDEHQPKSKNDSYLFSPAIFDPNKSTEENRGK